MKICPVPVFDCPATAVGCMGAFDACCVSQNGLFVFAQNYTTGLSYDGLNRNWTHNQVVAEIGPRFTIHGLWADNCDGSYNGTKWNADHTVKIGYDFDLYGCDQARSFENGGEILAKATDEALKAFVKANWRGGDGDDNWFLSHEWSKHGTCASSFNPSCYRRFKPYEDYYGYLRASVDVYKQLDILSAFSKAGIVPSDTVSYNLTDLNKAHETAFGFPGGMQCVKRNGTAYLNEVWTYLQERPGHKFQVASPSLVTAGSGPYQSCKITDKIYVPATPCKTAL